MNYHRIPRWAWPVGLVLALLGALAWGTAAHSTTTSMSRSCPAPQNPSVADIHLTMGGLTSNFYTSVIYVNGVLFGWLPNGGEQVTLTHGMGANVTHFVITTGTFDSDGTPHYADGQYHSKVTIDLPLRTDCGPAPTTTTTLPPNDSVCDHPIPADLCAPPTTVAHPPTTVAHPGTTSASSPTTSGSRSTAPAIAPPGAGPSSTLPPTGSNMPLGATSAALVTLALGSLAIAASRKRATS